MEDVLIPPEPTGRVLAQFREQGNTIVFFAADLGNSLVELVGRERREYLRYVIAHETAHWLCLKVRGGGFWGFVHNRAQDVLINFITLTGGGPLPVAGPGSETYWLIQSIIQIRERAADRLAKRFLRDYRAELESFITIT